MCWRWCDETFGIGNVLPTVWATNIDWCIQWLWLANARTIAFPCMHLRQTTCVGQCESSRTSWNKLSTSRKMLRIPTNQACWCVVVEVGSMGHATCEHFTRNGNKQQKRRCWQCKIDPKVVGGGSYICMLCCTRLDRCKCSDHNFASSKQCPGSANTNRLLVRRTATTKQKQTKKDKHTLQNIPFCQENGKHTLASPAPEKPAVCENMQRSSPSCQHISKRTGRPRMIKRCWQCKLDPAVVGGGEDLCARHFQRRDICRCPPWIENNLEEVVAHTHILLSMQPTYSASAAKCAVRRQRVLWKYGVALQTTGVGIPK